MDPPQAHPVPAAPPHRTQWWFFLTAFLAPVVMAVLFLQGHAHINRPRADIDGARLYYGVTLAAGALWVGLVAWQSKDAGVRMVAWSGGLGLPLAIALAVTAQQAYADFLGLEFAVIIFLIPALLVPAVGIPAAGLLRGWQAADRFAAVVTGAAGAGGAGAALYHLTTLSHQAALAEEAHRQAAGASLILVLATLAGLAVLARQRTG